MEKKDEKKICVVRLLEGNSKDVSQLRDEFNLAYSIIPELHKYKLMFVTGDVKFQSTKEFIIALRKLADELSGENKTEVDTNVRRRK